MKSPSTESTNNRVRGHVAADDVATIVTQYVTEQLRMAMLDDSVGLPHSTNCTSTGTQNNVYRERFHALLATDVSIREELLNGLFG